MSKLDDALKRFEQVATLGMRESDYIKVSDSLAWFREDLAVVKTALSKKDELLGLYQKFFNKLELSVVHDSNDAYTFDYLEINEDVSDQLELYDKIIKLEKEIEEMK